MQKTVLYISELIRIPAQTIQHCAEYRVTQFSIMQNTSSYKSAFCRIQAHTIQAVQKTDSYITAVLIKISQLLRPRCLCTVNVPVCFPMSVSVYVYLCVCPCPYTCLCGKMIEKSEDNMSDDLSVI
jgi:hypothetical protein